MNPLQHFRKIKKRKEMLGFYKRFLAPGDLCFDIGANNGTRTEIFFELGANVLCVEPQSKCYETLRKNFHNKKGIILLKTALGNSEREDLLMLCDETDQCATLSTEFKETYKNISGFHWEKTEKIKVTTLDKICKEYGTPKFCKMDVEGYESKVFEGLSIPIETISFEFNRPLITDTIKSLELLKKIAGYKCNFIRYEQMALALPHWIPIHEFQTKLETIIDKEILTGEIIVSTSV